MGMKVVVIMGGGSSEREISIKSGSAVVGALERKGFEVIPYDWDGSDRIVADLRKMRPDRVFVALHGKGGEDGKIQSILEIMGIPYTGPGPLGCGIAMDKTTAKRIMTYHQIPTPPFFIWEKGEDYGSYEPFPFPWVVKPSSEGSTVGVTIVRERGELKRALDEAFTFGDRVLVERYLEGREVTCGVVNGRVLPPLEIIPEGGFYDYKAKYLSTKTKYIVPAPLKEATRKKVEHYTFLAAKFTFNLSLCRVDFIIHKDLPYVLEINSIPGLTEKSLLPKEASAVGMSFDDLVEEILKGASFGKT